MSDPNFESLDEDIFHVLYDENWLCDESWFSDEPFQNDLNMQNVFNLQDNKSSSINTKENTNDADANLDKNFFLNPLSEQTESKETDLLFSGRIRLPKRKIVLDEKACELKSGYYATFTYKKSFPKENLLKIHNLFISPQLGLSKMTREETRQKDLYFQHYACKKDEILECLKNNKDIILSTILRTLKRKKNK